MNKYATDCTALDSARRKMVDDLHQLLKSTGQVIQRLRDMYGSMMSAAAEAAIIEQREKIYAVHDMLDDLRDYMREPEAWAPALPEPPEPDGFGFDLVAQANTAMDELLKKL